MIALICAQAQHHRGLVPLFHFWSEIAMGSPIVRRGVDPSKGHGCFPPTQPIQGSSNVRVNGFGAVRQGDMYSPHRCKDVVHAGRKALSSSTVRVNSRPVHRASDGISCGDSAGRGSPNVRAG